MATPSRILDALERALDALERGDLDAVDARMSLPRRRGADAPERLLVEARIASATDGPEAALEWLERAAVADPEWLWPHHDASYEHLARGASEDAQAAARRALERIEEDDAEGCLAVGELLLDLDLPADAATTLARAVELDPDDADAWHALGAALHALGDRDAATEAWLRARALDLAAPSPPWSFAIDEVEAIAERALSELPDEVVSRLRDVAILIDDAPTEAQVRDGVDPRLLGLFSGTPYPDKEGGASGGLDQATLFVRNLEAACADREDLAEQIRITLLHETAHFFGLEDEDLDAIGLG